MKKIQTYLLMEDPETMKKLTVEIFKSNDFEMAGLANSSRQCLKDLRNRHVDLLILDLMLSEIDGISLIKEMKRYHYSVDHIFCISAVFNQFIIKELNTLNIDYCFKKPIETSYFLKSIKTIITNYPQLINDPNIEFEITKILQQIGIPTHLKGYQYLRSAIMMCYEDETLNHEITSKLYPRLGIMYHTTDSCVERAMRNAIGIAWKEGDINYLTRHPRFHHIAFEKKPTNSSLVTLISDTLRISY